MAVRLLADEPELQAAGAPRSTARCAEAPTAGR